MMPTTVTLDMIIPFNENETRYKLVGRIHDAVNNYMLNNANLS